MHYRKMQFLDIETLRVYKWISTKIMTEIFPQMEPLNYKISQQSDFSTRSVGSAYDNIESIGYLWSNTRKLVPSHLKKQYLFKGFNIWHKKVYVKRVLLLNLEDIHLPSGMYLRLRSILYSCFIFSMIYFFVRQDAWLWLAFRNGYF